MKTLIFVLSMTMAATAAAANPYGTIAKCTRTDGIEPGQVGPSFYIMTNDFAADYSQPNDGLIVIESNDDFIAEVGTPVLANLVDIIRNSDGSYTIPNDGIYGDPVTFKEGEVTVNTGVHATFACEMTN